MKVRELVERLDEVMANVKIALIVNQQRIFESPHTSFEFTQRAIELQKDLERLEELKAKLLQYDPDGNVEDYLGLEFTGELLKFLDLLERSRAYLY